ncbi:MAG: histidine kinase dimerization/phosphoacceptor domain -containing protein [archaeon]|nr:histidine kinase dimerization/phosphoacceptor domain -containing protein [archaeon]
MKDEDKTKEQLINDLLELRHRVKDLTTCLEQRKQAEEEKNKLLKTIETTKEAINITSADGTITYTNDAMDELFGYKKGELIGEYPSILNAGPTPEDVTKRIMEAIKKEGYWEGEILNKRKDGSDFISYAKISALKDKDGNIINYLSTQHDITDRKRVEARIKASLREIEILLREIHHRVKNNLQIISALLNLQSQHVRDKGTFEIFTESRNRIKSTALIHEQLYQFKDLAKINLAEYIQKSATDLFYSYGVGRDSIELKINAHDVLLGVTTAIPCGLIINELVSKSLKI